MATATPNDMLAIEAAARHGRNGQFDHASAPASSPNSGFSAPKGARCHRCKRAGRTIVAHDGYRYGWPMYLCDECLTHQPRAQGHEED